jgi:hypothetical protein
LGCGLTTSILADKPTADFWPPLLFSQLIHRHLQTLLFSIFGRQAVEEEIIFIFIFKKQELLNLIIPSYSCYLVSSV